MTLACIIDTHVIDSHRSHWKLRVLACIRRVALDINKTRRTDKEKKKKKKKKKKKASHWTGSSERVLYRGEVREPFVERYSLTETSRRRRVDLTARWLAPVGRS